MILIFSAKSTMIISIRSASAVLKYRIERSLEDLCKGKTISAAAEKAGFSDSNYYSKVFAKVKGCSPREYRKRQ